MKNNIQFEKISEHIGHKIECVGYYKLNPLFLRKEICSASVECVDCNEVIYSEDNKDF